MVVATSVTAATTSTSTAPTIAMTETAPVTVPATVVSQPTSPNNGHLEVTGLPNVSPTAYQMLLKQVECLQMENCSLKAELKNNTSHISKLENEASRMKDMVLMLGKPTIPGPGLETNVSSNNNTLHPACMGPPFTLDDNAHSSPTDPAQPYPSRNSVLYSPLKIQSSIEQDARKYRSEHVMGPVQPHVPQNVETRNDVTPCHAALNGSVSPPPSTAVAEAIRRQLVSLKTEWSRILGMCRKEEKQKEQYMEQLNELNQRLDNVSDSDKFTKSNDKTRHQIDVEIANLQKKMEETLGSSDVMEGRLQAWLRQILMIEREIVSLEQHLHKLEMTPTSPDLPMFPVTHPNVDANGDQGSCTKHASFIRGAVRCTEISTQTPRRNGSLDGMTYEEEFSSCDNSVLDVQVIMAGGSVSRPTQTVASCLAGRVVQNPFPAAHVEMPGLLLGQHDPLSSKTDHKAPGSMESLPSQSDIDETASMHSFTTSLPRHFQSTTPGSKKDGGHSPSYVSANKEELGRRFCKMCKTAEGCMTMRQTGCIPIITQIIHDGSLLDVPPAWTHPPGPGRVSSVVVTTLKAAKELRIGLCQALRNIVRHAPSDGSKPGVEVHILGQLEAIRGYCEQLFEMWIYIQTLAVCKQDGAKEKSSPMGASGAVVDTETDPALRETADKVEGALASPGTVEKFDFRTGLITLYKPPMHSISAIMKLSHNEAVRGVINELGGLFAVAELFILHCRCVSSTEKVYAVGGDLPRPDDRVFGQLQLLRRFVGFSLINLTYGDMLNKATLIQMPGLLDMVMMQLSTESEEMQQVMGRFLRNLSWQPDEKSRDILREKNVVTVLMNCALKSKREVTLKSVLSALWNLSGHCLENRASICSVKGALAFLVWTLTYRSPSKSPVIIESGGGILRNVSSVVATSEEYRQILRKNNCLQILLTHLKAASLTIVSNACGTLWNLSARNAQDQKLLWDLGAVTMLRNLVHSKHSVIAQGSSAALRNLLANRPDKLAGSGADKGEATKLKARKQKSLDSAAQSKTMQEPVVADNFSPRHHTWTAASAHEKAGSPHSAVNNQRRSLQETSSSSPVSDHDRKKKFQKGGIHYSGSLGSLPNSDSGEAFSKSYAGTSSKYVAGARNSNSYPDHYSAGATNSFGLRSSLTMDFSHQRSSSGFHPGGFSPIGTGGMLKDVLMSSDATATQNGTPAQQAPSAKGDDKTVTSKRIPNINMRQYLQLLAGGKMPPGALSSSFGATPHQYTPYMQQSRLISPHTNTQTRLFQGPTAESSFRQVAPQRSSRAPSNHEATPPQNLYLANSPSPPAWSTTAGASGSPVITPPNETPADRPQRGRGHAFGMTGSQRIQSLIKNAPIQGLGPSPSIMLNPHWVGPPKNPDELVRALRNAEEGYGDDDDLVNYSLQYRDEHMTPGIQSPRTEEIYENACESIGEGVVMNHGGPNSQTSRFLHAQMGGSTVPSASMNGPATHSEGGMSGLSSCVDSTGSNGAMQRHDPNGNPYENSGCEPHPLPACKQGVTRFSAEHTLLDPGDDMRYNDPMAFDDEKPTDFSARYAEEQLYEPIQHQSMGLLPYPGTHFDPHVGNDSPLQSEMEYLKPSARDPSRDCDAVKADAGEHRREEEDKFDSGAITPAHYYHHTKSGRNSGIMTPRTPGYQETPMMFSRSSSPDSISDCGSIHSSMTSEPGSRMISGNVSPSQLPDSPSQSMPVSPRRSPRSQSLANLNQDRQSTNLPKFVDRPQMKPKPRATFVPSGKLNGENSGTSVDGVTQVPMPSGTAMPGVSASIEQRLKKMEEPGYTSSLPHKDEMSVFKSEGAMSVITTFSALTIDSGDKIAPILGDRNALSAVSGEKTAGSNRSLPENRVTTEDDNALENAGGVDSGPGQLPSHPGQRAVVNAGYITSLPTSDEIMNFMHEGTLSPMSAFSEMSCLKDHNDGFENRSVSTYSIPNSSSSNRIRSIGSNKTSFASRSSATGASFPPPPESKTAGSGVAGVAGVDDDQSEKPTSPKDTSTVSSVTSRNGLSAEGGGDDDLDDDLDDSLPSSSSDDDDLLKRCINHAIPKKKSSRNWSSKSSTRSGGSRSSSRGGKSSRSKDKSSSEAPSSSKPAQPPKPAPPLPDKDEDPLKKEENRRATNPSPEVVKERVKLINIKEKIAAADSKLKSKGLTITQYMDNIAKMDDSAEAGDGTAAARAGPSSGVERSKHVKGNVDTLQQSYSVKRKLRENEKQANRNAKSPDKLETTRASIPKTTGFLPTESSLSVQSSLRIQSYLREGMASYATEGTPIEMSRSTSLSNLSIESDGLEITDLPTLQSRLKTSHSVPDIKSDMAGAKNITTVLVNASPVPASATEPPGDTRRLADSREILEDLGKQIETLSLNVAEAAITSSDPGYVTSLPHTDEIKKYAAEGSLAGATEFSALTIDSDTRIAPLQSAPMEGIAEAASPRETVVPAANDGIAARQPGAGTMQQRSSVEPPPSSNTVPQAASVMSQPSNAMPQLSNATPINATSQLQTANTRSDLPPGSTCEKSIYAMPQDRSAEDMSHASSSKSGHTVAKQDVAFGGGQSMLQATNSDTKASTLQTESFPFNHYDNDNDGMPVKEERITFKNEDTPICFTSNSSLSSLSSEGDWLLKDCITSALPQEKNLPTSLDQMAMQPPSHLDTLGRYNDGVPDGKVDSPTGHHIPFFTQRHPQPLQTRSQTFVSSPTSVQSPSEEQWQMFQRESEAMSAQILQQSGRYHSSGHGVDRFGDAAHHSDLPSSYSFPENMDGLYYSRQRDSDVSLGSSAQGEQQYSAGAKAVHQQCKPRSRQHSERMAAGSRFSPTRRSNSRAGKMSASTRPKESASGRHGRNVQMQGKDSSSESSPSYRQHNQRRRHISTGNSRVNDRRNESCSCQIQCSKASSQPRCFHRNVVSASTSRLEQAMSPPRSRRRSTNSASKNSFTPCEQHSHHYQPKPNRSRVPAKNVYHPSVTQLYPPLKDMRGVLKGVASVAARGDKVVAERGGVQYPSGGGISKSSTSSLSTGRSLVRQGTFITDAPSPVLLQNMTKKEQEKIASKSASSVSSMSPPPSFRSSRSAGNTRATTPRVTSSRGSTHSVRSHSVASTNESLAVKPNPKKKGMPTQPKPKQSKNKVWNGIKKLLSPSDDTKPVNKSTPQKRTKSTNPIKAPAKDSKAFKSPKNTKKLAAPLLKTSGRPTTPGGPNTMALPLGPHGKKPGSGSSLSLSSSSASDNSGSDAEVVAPQSAAAPYGHLPKSPSAGAIGSRTISSIPRIGTHVPKSQSGSGSVWRRTPPFSPSDTNVSHTTADTSPPSSRGSESNRNFMQRSNTYVTSERPNRSSSTKSEPNDVWVSQRHNIVRKGTSMSSVSSTASRSSTQKGQNQVSARDGVLSEVADRSAKNGVSELLTPGFPPPPRTQSPRVVQQVAPFNYRPRITPDMSSATGVWVEKKSRDGRQSGQECKQTSV